MVERENVFLLSLNVAFVEQETELWQEVAAIAQDEGLVLYDLEQFAERGLRISVSRATHAAGSVSAPRPNSVSSEDCTRLCRRLMVYFSVEGPRFGILPEPQIEVCSPGINRALRLMRHYTGAVGLRVKVVWEDRTQPALKQSRTSVGQLLGVSGGNLLLLDENEKSEQRIAIIDVKKAQVDHKF